MGNFLFEGTIYLGAAVIAVPLAARFGLGSVLGYLLAGLAIGPLTGLTGHEVGELRHLGEFGVVMMLFLIGLELNPRGLWEMRLRLAGLGGLQILLTAALVAVALAALGFAFPVALAVGLIVSLSSTAIVLQTLTEKGLFQTAGGRASFSVLLAQDIAVIPMLAGLPLLATLRPPATEIEGATLSLVEGLPAWAVTSLTLGAVAAIVLGGRFLARPLFHFIDSARLSEMYTAVALLIVVGIAALMSLVGLSPALGAFLAGVVLGSSEFRHQLEVDIQPFKGLLLGLFFITVGAGIDIGALTADPLRLLALALGLMTTKLLVLVLVGRAFGLLKRDLSLFTLGLAQTGEFGFVLVAFGFQQGVLPLGVTADLYAVIALSMLLTPLAFIAHELIDRRHHHPGSEPDAPDEIDERHRVIIAGCGRFGQVVHRVVTSTGFNATVLDHNLGRVQFMRRLGVKTFLGDPTRPDMMQAAGLATASILVVAINNPEGAVRMVQHAKRVRPDIIVIARARDRAHTYELLHAGADHVVRELFDSALRAGRYVLEHIGLSEYEAAEAERLFFQHDRHTIHELNELWQPNIDLAKNQPYLDRAIALEKDMRTALLAQLTPEVTTLADKVSGAEGAASGIDPDD